MLLREDTDRNFNVIVYRLKMFIMYVKSHLQCSGTVGWVTGRASGM